MIASEATVIRTLRIKTATSDRLAAQQQTERALQAAALRPIGLPRDAILIVRHITARCAGAPGWEHAVNAQLDQLAQQAARPIEGVVPANAQAVIFADRSELLACLAADWCAGVIRSQWWWQSLLRNDDITRAVLAAWLAAPEYIPRALQRLSVRQQAIAFVQQLSDAPTHALLNAVVQTFGLYELAIRLAETNELEPEGREVITQPSTRNTSTLPAQVRPTPPWQPWMRTHVEHLSFDRQVLLGVGVMLHEAPAIVRSVSFASEVKAWHAAIRVPQQPQHLSNDSTPLPASTLSPVTTAEATATPQAQESFSTRAMEPEESISATPSLRGGTGPTKQSPPDQHDEPITYEMASPPSTTPPKAASPLGTLAMTEIEPTQVEIETDFGGVCYFINLGLFLNLYGDFTTPLQPGLDLPIWDFMVLVAQELIGDEVTHDPIWPLLAQLADRAEDELPGANFDPTRHVIVTPLDSAGQVSAVGDEAISPDKNGDCFAPAGLAMTPLDVWLADLMSIIRPRLQLALGVKADEVSRYFKQSARIVVRALNFDAYFALADLPIEIRLSGLDRDPGWVPAAGRTVRFHYD